MATTKWLLDPLHSELQFKIKHLMISNVSGALTSFKGEVETEEEDFSTAKISLVADMRSISTNNEQRDAHLRNADFFEVEKYPNITFKSTKILETGKPNQYLLYGDLTIKDVTKPVIFDVTYGGKVTSDQGEKIGVKAKTTINRFDYNINFDPAAAGVGKDVTIVVHSQFAKQ